MPHGVQFGSSVGDLVLSSGEMFLPHLDDMTMHYLRCSDEFKVGDRHRVSSVTLVRECQSAVGSGGGVAPKDLVGSFL